MQNRETGKDRPADDMKLSKADESRIRACQCGEDVACELARENDSLKNERDTALKDAAMLREILDLHSCSCIEQRGIDCRKVKPWAPDGCPGCRTKEALSSPSSDWFDKRMKEAKAQVWDAAADELPNSCEGSCFCGCGWKKEFRDRADEIRPTRGEGKKS